MAEQHGLVHIYTGDGKGKTTALIGQAVRAWGDGYRILFVQLMKSSPTGEMESFSKLGERIDFRRVRDITGFVWNMNDEEKAACKASTTETFQRAVSDAQNGGFDMIVFDEIMSAISTGMLDESLVTGFLDSRPAGTEVLLSGRNAPASLVERADYVSDVRLVKHPFTAGVPARRGIEF